MTYELGIDLGTTWTAAAVFRGERAAIVNLGTRQAAVPSVVYVGADGSVLVGEAAERRVLTEPERVARQFKRRIGDPAPILLGGSPHSAELLTSKLLRWVVDAVASREGEMPTTITITHPANWGAYKKDLLEQAVHLAGLSGPGNPTIRLLSEPEAAAIHYASTERVEPGQAVAVYDLGGGTFDVAILRATGDSFAILGAPEGIERLGGIDFDAAVLGHVSRTLGGLDELDPDDPAVATAVAHLRDQCTAAKEALSTDTQTIVPVMLPGRHTEVRLTRSELEAMVRPALDETIAATTRALRTAGLQASDLRAIVLVGGSSRIPLVAQLVTSALGRPVAVDTDPKHAIALGAARHAHLTATGPGAITSPSRQTAEGLAAAQPPSPTAPGQMPVAAVSPFATPPPPTRSGPIRTPPPTPPPTSSIIPPPSMTPAPTTTPPPYVPPVTGPSVGDGGETPPSGKRKRTGLVVAAVIIAVALIAGGIAVFAGGGGSGSASDTTAATDDTSGADTTVAGGSGDISAPLESGLLSALDFEPTTGTVTLQGEAAFPSDVLCDAEDVIDTSNFVDYRSRLFADNPDFSGKKAAAGAIEFPDSASADAFLLQLNDFGASHVVSDACPLQPVDFFDGTVAFKETPAGGGDQGAIGFAKVDPDVVVFVGFGDPTGMDTSSVQFLVQEQKQKMEAALNGTDSSADTTSVFGADNTDAAGGSTLQQMQAALITPDDVGTSFDQAITSVDPEVDYLCYSQPSADRSSATEVDEKLFGPDGATEVAVVTLSFPDAASAATYLSTTESFLTDNARSGCNLTAQPTDALESSTTLDDSFTFTFDGGNGRSQATWAKLGNTVVVVIGNPLAAVPVDDLVSLQVSNLNDAGLVTD